MIRFCRMPRRHNFAALLPPELRKAHQANDRAVLKAYGFDPSLAEAEIVAKLMDRYRKLTAGSGGEKNKKKYFF